MITAETKADIKIEGLNGNVTKKEYTESFGDKCTKPTITYTLTKEDFITLLHSFEEKKLKNKYRNALRQIDTHIRADENPVPYIVETLKNTLPEYKGE